MASQATQTTDAQTTTITGDTTTFFEDGTLLDADEVARRTDTPDTLAEWLESVNSDRYAKWVKACKTNMFPNATDEELLNHAVKNEIEEAEAEGRTITPNVEDNAPSLVVTHHSEATNDRFMPEQTQDISWLPETAQELMKDACINTNCDSKNVQSKQMQMGGADEGMTGFHTCQKCGTTWKTGYGA